MANEGGKKFDIARHGAMHKTIPTNVTHVATSAAGSTFDLAALVATDGVAGTHDLRGKWITLQALTFDVTLLRKASVPTTVGQGFVLGALAPPEPYFVDPDETTVVGFKAAGVGSLEICWDAAL